MTHGSLFSGIGGFDLAAQWMGWENIFHCEYDPFCQRVLSHHFPQSKLYEDVRTMDATQYRGQIDVLSGGFPCQPFSTAGKRKGTEDERHLWPSMLRIIREVQPRHVIGENVRGILSWNDGLVFEEVCSDLENAGYEVTPYILPACGVGAPHRRDRVWFVAHSHDFGKSRTSRRDESESRGKGVQERDEVQHLDESDSVRGFSPDTDSGRCETDYALRESKREVESTWANGESLSPDTHSGRLERTKEEGRDSLNVEWQGIVRDAPDTDIELSECRDENREDGRSEQTQRTQPLDESRGWEEFPTQPPICGGDDGLPRKLDAITFPKWRKESIKAYGNAIVPQVALQIFKAIQLTEAQRANY